MKQSFNIVALICVLSVPFALSSQTRKAIPAGRYEALSGVKNSRSAKSATIESNEKADSVNLVWNEAQKYIAQTKNPTYFTKSDLDPAWTELLTSRGLSPAKTLNPNTALIFSEDLKKDKEIFRQLSRGKIIILKDRHALSEIVGPAQSFDVLAYQALENSEHLYLLRKK